MNSTDGNNHNNSCFMGFGENLNSCGANAVMILPNSSSSNNNTLFQNQNNFNTTTNENILTPFLMENNQLTIYTDHGASSSSSSTLSLRAKIMAHPHYHRLLAAYVNCQKIGAPPEVVAGLEEAYRSVAVKEHIESGRVGEDPGLDQFMEAYCEMLTKYEQELSKPFEEAMLFLSRIESQFKALALPSSDSVGSSDLSVVELQTVGSSELAVVVSRKTSDGWKLGVLGGGGLG